MNALHDAGKGVAAGQAVHLLNGLDFTVHGALESIVVGVFCAEGADAVGDQPGGGRLTAQALLDLIEVLVTQRAQKPPHGNTGGAGLLRNAVGGLERQLLRIAQQITGDALAGGGQVGELVFQQLKKTVLFQGHKRADGLIVIGMSFACLVLRT